MEDVRHLEQQIDGILSVLLEAANLHPGLSVIIFAMCASCALSQGDPDDASRLRNAVKSAAYARDLVVQYARGHSEVLADIIALQSAPLLAALSDGECGQLAVVAEEDEIGD